MKKHKKSSQDRIGKNDKSKTRLSLQILYKLRKLNYVEIYENSSFASDVRNLLTLVFGYIIWR